MPRQALTVAGLMRELQAAVHDNPAAAGWPVVLAIDPEGTLGRPVGVDSPVGPAGYRALEKGHGDLRGDVDNCVVIWPAV